MDTGLQPWSRRDLCSPRRRRHIARQSPARPTVPQEAKALVRLTTDDNKLPLEGVKVADFSWFGAGPICARILATYGATVVRVESETHVDSLRTVAPFAKGRPATTSAATSTTSTPASYGITLNMNTEKGHEIARKLVEWADIFLTNITPRVIERWGLTYDRLSQIEPARSSPAYQPMQGYDGPHRDFLGFGAVLTPITGYNYLSGFPDRHADRPGHELPRLRDQPGPHAHRDPGRAALPQPHRQGPANRLRATRVVGRAARACRSSTTPRTGACRTAPGNRCRTPRLTTPSNASLSPTVAVPIGRTLDRDRLLFGRGMAGAGGGDGQPGVGDGREVRDHAGRKANEDELEANINAWRRGQGCVRVDGDLQRAAFPRESCRARARCWTTTSTSRSAATTSTSTTRSRALRARRPAVRPVEDTGELRAPAPLLGEHTEYVARRSWGWATKRSRS